jgi:hypothetical protein
MMGSWIGASLFKGDVHPHAAHEAALLTWQDGESQDADIIFRLATVKVKGKAQHRIGQLLRTPTLPGRPAREQITDLDILTVTLTGAQQTIREEDHVGVG